MSTAKPASASSASVLTLGSDEVLCGSGALALRRRQLRLDHSAGSSGKEAGPVADADDDPETHFLEEVLTRLRAVKVEEAWQGRDSFAEMEAGMDLLGHDMAPATGPAMGTERHPTRLRPSSARRHRPGPGPDSHKTPAAAGTHDRPCGSAAAEVLVIDHGAELVNV